MNVVQLKGERKAREGKGENLFLWVFHFSI